MRALLAHWEAFLDHVEEPIKTEDIDLALTQIEENNKRWIEIKGKINDKTFIIADQLKDANNCQRKLWKLRKITRKF